MTNLERVRVSEESVPPLWKIFKKVPNVIILYSQIETTGVTFMKLLGRILEMI